VLQELAGRLGFESRIGRLGTAHQVLDWLGSAPDRPPAPANSPAEVVQPGPGQAVLSTWRYLVDDSAGLDGDPWLASAAPAPVARIGASTAASIGLVAGDSLTVSTDQGQITLPAVIDDLPPGVVHLPTKSPGSWVMAALAAADGALVQIAAAKPGEEVQS
jgi:NADH-quinone oxidoreductase subunit G